MHTHIQVQDNHSAGIKDGFISPPDTTDFDELIQDLSFSFNNIELKYAAISVFEDLIPSAAPIGVILTGGQLQLRLIDTHGTSYQSYVYWYTAHEGGIRFILDSLIEE